jgi:hypothetical protein
MLPYLLAAGSTLLSMNAKARSGEAEAEAGAADLMDSALSGHFREKGVIEKRDRALSRIRARAGASGVELAGSALEVLMNSASQAERDLFIARHVSQRASEAAGRRMDRGESMQKDAYLEGTLGLASTAVSAGKDYAGGYKAPGKKGFDLTDEEMQQYGWD